MNGCGALGKCIHGLVKRREGAMQLLVNIGNEAVVHHPIPALGTRRKVQAPSN